MSGIGSRRKITIAMGVDDDMEGIYRLRHEVYASELGQHRENEDGILTDELDSFNSYIVAKVGGALAGFISLTPPGGASYSVDKYFSRSDIPVAFDEELYELRIMTVAKKHRNGLVAPALMYAALRWIEDCGGSNIVAIGRVELMGLYLKAGLRSVGKRVDSGMVRFELLTGTADAARDCLEENAGIEQKLADAVDWRLDFAMMRPAACFHGGAFFDAIGRDFNALEKIDDVINADVLDAWFPPSPNVMSVLRDHLRWSVVTSPPTGCEGLIGEISRVRGVDANCVIAGTGSSSLIFLAFMRWLSASSKVLILDPGYGEYAHVVENVIRCKVDRFRLSRSDGYQVDLRLLKERINDGGYDLVVIVNPNNPTGRHIPRCDLEEMLDDVSSDTLFWIDETYVDYVGACESLEGFAASSRNVVVCKSMSKAYALSGLRVGYLCCPSRLAEELRSLTPPWSVSLPGQLAGVKALQDPDYYSQRYRETDQLRAGLTYGLQTLGDIELVPSVANYVLFHLPEDAPDSATVIERCRRSNLFLRDSGATSSVLGVRALRIAVKGHETNFRMVEIMRHAMWQAELV